MLCLYCFITKVESGICFPSISSKDNIEISCSHGEGYMKVVDLWDVTACGLVYTYIYPEDGGSRFL
jgi:hypothetical protein